MTFGAGLQRLPPEAAGDAPVLWLLQLPGEGDLFLYEPPHSYVGPAHGRVGSNISLLATGGAIPDLEMRNDIKVMYS